MSKIIGKFSIIIFLNLFAFLAIWHILDLNLNTNSRYKIIFLILSVISLIFISKSYFNKALKNFEEISPIIDKNNNKNNESK